MSKKNCEVNDQASGSSLSTIGKQKQSSALPTFFRWFKKSNHKKSSKYYNGKVSSFGSSFGSKDCSSQETLSETSSPVLFKRQLSPSSSCDSVISTSTTGFAFIRPSNYPQNANNNGNNTNFIENDIETDSLLRRVRIHNNRQNAHIKGKTISLKEKYCLFESDTLNSNCHNRFNNCEVFNDRSLPNSKKSKIPHVLSISDSPVNCRRNHHRRTASDSSKDKKSGAYVHVKGKRKAPPPPPTQISPIQSTVSKKQEQQPEERITPIKNLSGVVRLSTAVPQESISSEPGQLTPSSSFYDSISPSSTLGAKKRKAPAPPTPLDLQLTGESPRNSIFSDGLFNENDMQSIFGEATFRENVALNTEAVQSPSLKDQEITKSINASPLVQISPKPWYKRSITSNRDSSIPFKREVVLKTMEKRKCNQKGEDECASNLPEMAHARTSIFDSASTSKFGFFMRHRDDEKISKNKEKRKSGIAIPNISELDREAVEIFNKTQDKNGAEHLILQQKMFETNFSSVKEQSNTAELEEHNDTVKTTKELIAKFDASDNSPKIHLNTSYIGKMDNFSDKKIQQTDLGKNLEISKELNETNKIGNHNVNDKLINDPDAIASVNFKKKNNDDTKLTTMTWACPFCTLENPSWRIICEVCEKLKPYEKITNNSEKSLTKTEQCNFLLNNKTEQNSRNNWDKKTEMVLKYFNATNSSSANNRQSIPSNQNPKLISPLPMDAIATSEEKKLNTDLSQLINREIEFKQPLLDSSMVLTTVTPVFYATKSSQNSSELIDNKKPSPDTNDEALNIENIRNARLAKFQRNKVEKCDEVTVSSEKNVDDPNWLVAERKRLREKIRAMNAKALADKYPIVDLKGSLKEVNKDDNKENNKDSDESVPNEIQTENVSPKNIQNQKTDKMENIDDYNRGAIKKIPNNNNDKKILSNGPTTLALHANENNIRKTKVSSSAQTTSVVKRPTSTFDELMTKENSSDNNTNVKKRSIYGNPVVGSTSIVLSSMHQNSTNALKTANGEINNWKENLKNPTKIDHRNYATRKTDTIALSKMMRDLELAISEGQNELAANLAMDLAKLRVTLQVTKSTTNRNSGAEIDLNQNVTVDLFIKDKISQRGPIKLQISPFMTVMELKQKIFHEFEISVDIQRWLINDTFIFNNHISLFDCGVKNSFASLHLYIITRAPECKSAIISKAQPEDDDLSDSSSISHNDEAPNANEFDQGAIARAIPHIHPDDEYDDHWKCPICTLVNKPNSLYCVVCTKAKPKFIDRSKPIQYDFFNESTDVHDTNKTKIQIRPYEKRNDLNKLSPNRKSSDIFNIIDQQETINASVPTKIQLQSPFKQIMKTSTNFSSPNITRSKYRGVDNFNPNRVENIIETKDSSKNGNISLPSAYTPNHYLELLKLDEADIVVNLENFECPICFAEILSCQGAVLRDCLHTFCKDCLRNTIQHSDEAVVKCPYMDAIYSCDSHLQEREIRALVTKELYEKHLAKSIREAEHKIENAFHCKTPNCRGWCIYEDNVNQFKCPVCKISNCLTCRVIHDGLTCKQFQDRLNSDCDSNIEARRTRDMLAKMVEKGEALNCPTCQVIMMKKWGCDWLKCSMCKTEVCWVTRGPRWGPEGKGDTTGGCKCGVDGKKCHPKCNYCH